MTDLCTQAETRVCVGVSVSVSVSVIRVVMVRCQGGDGLVSCFGLWCLSGRRHRCASGCPSPAQYLHLVWCQ